MRIGTDLEKACQCLERGELIGLPTETVYGLGVDAQNTEAILRLFATKGRPSTRPLSILIPNAQAIAHYALDTPDEAYRLTQAFWPGPLTLVVKKRPEISDALTGGLDTIGLRCPDHALTQGLLSLFGRPIAAPSANLFSKPPSCDPISLSTVFNAESVPYILNGGTSTLGQASTILDMSVRPFQLIRQGAITQEQIDQLLEEDHI